MRHVTDPSSGHFPRASRRLDRTTERAIVGLFVFVFVGGLAALAALVPVGHGFVPKGGGWFNPAVVGGAFTLHPLFIAVPWAACFVLGLLDWRRPWRVEHLDLLALAGFFPVAMLLSDDVSPAGLWLAAACLGWLFYRMLGASLGAWPMPQLRPSLSSERLGLAIVMLLLARIGTVAVAGNISEVGQASSLGAWRVLHGLHLYGAVSWPGPGQFRVGRPDSYGPFAYYAYLPFALLFPSAPALLATLLPAVCFDALTLAGLHTLPLITSGPGQFLDSTFGYQLIQRGGGVQFSIWTYMPHAAIVARPVLAVALVLLALSPMARPRVQDAREHAALAAALLIGAQLLLGYWFYSYLTWCYPLLLIAIIRARPDRVAASTSALTMIDTELCPLPRSLPPRMPASPTV